MKIILIGANGKIGELVQKALAGAGHEIVKVGQKSGDFRVQTENRESVRKLYQAVGSFDAVAIAAGQVAFAPLSELAAEKWQFSLGSKLMGQFPGFQASACFRLGRKWAGWPRLWRKHMGFQSSQTTQAFTLLV